MTVFIGDIHGEFDWYRKVIAACTDSIQVGDFGIGFGTGLSDNHSYIQDERALWEEMEAGRHCFIRGNHDNPHVCPDCPQWIPDGHYDSGVMFVGGASSIDRAYRRAGIDWWDDEELSHLELGDQISYYHTKRPRVMVTHDCPGAVAGIMLANAGRRRFGSFSRTQRAFQSMWEMHQPDIWVFGHWHMSADFVADGTRFVCLDVGQVRDIDVGL